MPHKITNAAGKAVEVKTFHEHGRTHGTAELRITVLLPLLMFREKESNSMYEIHVDSLDKQDVYLFTAPITGADKKQVDAAKAQAHKQMSAASLEWDKRVDLHFFAAESLVDLTIGDFLHVAEEAKENKLEISPANASDYFDKAGSGKDDKEGQ